MARIANPLRLGVQSEQAFTLEGTSGYWDTHFTREIYTHVTPPMRSDAADRVAEQIFGKVEPGKA